MSRENQRKQMAGHLQRADQSLGRRRRHEVEVQHVVDAERFELEHHRREVGSAKVCTQIIEIEAEAEANLSVFSFSEISTIIALPSVSKWENVFLFFIITSIFI